MAAVRAGNVIVHLQRFANADRDCFFAAIKVRESGHQRARVKFVHLFLEQANANHLAVRMKPTIFFCGGCVARFRLRGGGRHFFGPPVVTGVEMPDMAASTSNMQAKSYFVQPMPRAAVRNSLLAAVVGSGTSSCLPRSMASTISFCIMLTSNHASSGCCRTNGPRYLIIGEATALLTSTSTATSRAMPLFSASSTPSENASICTARLRLIAIFIDRANPLSPT